MTQEMIDLQNEAVSELFECVLQEEVKECTFKAPTGSGKTYMMSDLMNRILEQDKNVVFVVSTLSKSELGEQNYESFVKFSATFTQLKPYLINSDTSEEEALFIPLGYNVYVLPRDLYRKGAKLKAGALQNFLNEITGIFAKSPKKLYLIKDECHQATSNLDELIKGYFKRVINISATPTKEQMKLPKVTIADNDAVRTRLIKEARWDESIDGKVIAEDKYLDKEDMIKFVLDEFKALQKRYQDNNININPCLIVQISNTEKGNKEIETVKKAVEESGLKYMLIVNKEKSKDKDKISIESNTNDRVGQKTRDLRLWKKYAKENTSSIDIIIFKMVISEGWDIRRACMLYQVRDSKSEQLNEQVIGRVRRNPCLEHFESLNETQKELISKAYIYGTKLENNDNNTVSVRLKGEMNKETNEIINAFKISITQIKEGEKLGFNAQSVIENDKNNGKNFGIFELVKRLQSHKNLAMECKNFAKNDGGKWFEFASHFDTLKKEFDRQMEDYETNLEIKPDEKGFLALQSFFTKSDNTFDGLEQWFWELENGDKFAFDSKAEVEWVGYMRGLCKQGLVRSVVVNGEKIYLFGKNYLYKSSIKFDYYMNGAVHSSYPDFVLKDTKDRIHIFEVKSVDNAMGVSLQYEAKNENLARAYRASSKKMPYFFWMPIKQKEDRWVLKCFFEGEDKFSGEPFSQDDTKNRLEKILKE